MALPSSSGLSAPGRNQNTPATDIATTTSACTRSTQTRNLAGLRVSGRDVSAPV